MKVARVYGRKDLRIEEENLPDTLEKDEVLIKTKRVGICGSDMHIYHGTNPLATLPRIMGHEVAGEVYKLGENVTDLKIGDHIVVEPISYCGKCYACRNGVPNVCEHLSVFGVHEDGGMREYFKLPEKQCHKISKDVDWDTAVLAEPLTIGANSILRSQLKLGDTVLIQGAGPIGITVLKIAKLQGARVMISDMVADKLKFAKKCGADAICDVSNEDLYEAVMNWTNGEGANIVIDAVCLNSTFENSVNVASAAGTVVVLGFGEEPANIPQLPITKKQLTIVGSRLQSYRFVPIIKMLESGQLKNDGLVTHKFKFENIQQAFETLENEADKVRKALLVFNEM